MGCPKEGFNISTGVELPKAIGLNFTQFKKLISVDKRKEGSWDRKL